jgi:hypothetical protein
VQQKFWDSYECLSPSFENFDLGMVNLDILNQLCCLHETFVLPSYKLFAGTQKSIMIFHCGKTKVANIMFQANNHLWYNEKSRSTFFQGRENDASIMMIVTYGPTPCSFPFLRMVFCATKIMTKQMTYSYTMHILWPFCAIIFQVMKILE